MKQIELKFQEKAGLNNQLVASVSKQYKFYTVLHKNVPREEGSLSITEGKEMVGVGVEFKDLPMRTLNAAILRDLAERGFTGTDKEVIVNIEDFDWGRR